MATRGVSNVEVTNYSGGKPENVNQIRVEIGGLELFFSYQTLVAFRYVSFNAKVLIAENQWGPTTGKHIAKIKRETGGLVLDAEAFEFLTSELRDKINAALSPPSGEPGGPG